MLEWKSINPKTDFQKKAVMTYTDYIICKEFWWTFEDIEKMPWEFYDDIILILQKQQAKSQSKRKKL